MKKLLTIMLGLAFLAGTGAYAAPKKKGSKKEPAKEQKQKQPPQEHKGGKQSQPGA